jgi:hypothetical protein
MNERFHTLFLCTAMVAGCGGAVHHADEPTLASQAQPLAALAAGDVASACDRTVWSFSPTTTGTYRFDAHADVAMSLRLFSMSPDLYLDTGRTGEDGAHLEARLDAGEHYAVTMASTECRAAHYEITVAQAE